MKYKNCTEREAVSPQKLWNLCIFLLKITHLSLLPPGEADFAQTCTLAAFWSTLYVRTIFTFNFAQVGKSILGSWGSKHLNICPSQDNYFIKRKLGFIQQHEIKIIIRW